MNPVLQLLKGLVEDAENIRLYYRNKWWNLADPELPVNAAASFVRDQLKEVQAEAKAQAAPKDEK